MCLESIDNPVYLTDIKEGECDSKLVMNHQFSNNKKQDLDIEFY